MQTKKLYISPSIMEISIAVCDIIAASPTPDDKVYIDIDIKDREDEGYAD